jgi:hypothetical protein
LEAAIHGSGNEIACLLLRKDSGGKSKRWRSISKPKARRVTPPRKASASSWWIVCNVFEFFVHVFSMGFPRWCGV